MEGGQGQREEQSDRKARRFYLMVNGMGVFRLIHAVLYWELDAQSS